jgi:hypothetical protein
LLDKKADDIWIKIVDVISTKCAEDFPVERLRKILEIQDSGYDAIPLSEDVWCPGVQKVLNLFKSNNWSPRPWVRRR